MAHDNALAGKKAVPELLQTIDKAKELYFSTSSSLIPVKSGTSGHRGTVGTGFSRLHVRSIIQALADIRREKGTYGPSLPASLSKIFEGKALGPVIIGKDIRFASDFAHTDAIEVFAGNGMKTVIHKGGRSTPTPVISHRILAGNNKGENCEGVIITASHNPPEEGGIKSNGRDGGPNTETKPLDEKANYYMKHENEIRILDILKAESSGLVKEEDMVHPYVSDLKNVVRMDVIKGFECAATPLDGSANGYYEAINAAYNTKVQVIFPEPDKAGMNRTYDWDGKLRGDPSSKFVMMAVAGILDELSVPVVLANDNDADRFGGEDSGGILNPNHVLCVLFDYLCRERGFDPKLGLGRSIGSTHMLDLIAADYKRPVNEVNVGFKHYVKGLINGEYVLAGEESAGLCIPRLNGRTWVTEKDGIVANLLIMEVTAKTGKNISTLYNELVKKYGPHQYERIDTPASEAKKKRLAELLADPNGVKNTLSGKKIAGKNILSLKIGDGVKIVLEGGIWILFRASGTENIIKVYREELGFNLNTARKATEELESILSLK